VTCAKAIDEAFGSFDAFKEAFGKAATTRFGSGWGWLCKDDSGKLSVCSGRQPGQPDHGQDFGGCCAPVLGLDVWEHAYYLTTRTARPDYIAAFWNVVNWTWFARQFAR